MPFQPGEHLGPYEITAFIGAGGMGEVYRARDTRLGRTVAIKVLSAEIAQQPELRERFAREAQTISTLNHPNICTLHDVGHHPSTRSGQAVDYLVMEFLEGETLADRLARGPLPVKEALTIAAQVGEGLEAAHRQGIVHRDLKPGNIMLVKADGAARSQAKLLDFGLAKLRGGVADNTPVVVSAARTDVGNLTAVGAVLGTLQYMSPEQLEGREADARADIFALGTMLYEMVTGRKAFEGKSQVSLMAAILEQDPPPISSLQPISPRALDHLVRGCLAKEPAERWQNAADVVKQITWIGNEIATSTEERRADRAPALRERAIWATALIALGVALAVLAIRQILTPSAPAAIVRFEIPVPGGGAFTGANSTPRMAVSPDGQYVVFTVNFRDGKPDQLWIRRLDSLQSTALVTVTEETVAEPVQQPFWSPDSRQVGFFIDGKLKKVDVAGGVVQTLCSVAGNNFGGTWNTDGTILFGSSLTRGLQRVPASGGVPLQVTRLDAQAKEIAHLWPRFLPDGRHYLYQAHGLSGGSRAIYVGSLDSPGRTRLFTSQFMVDFAPPNRLLLLREGALLAQRFDTSTLQLEGEPTVLAEGVQASQSNGRAGFSVSATGVLVYRPGVSSSAADAQLAWVDRTGKEVDLVGPPGSYRGLALSPDGQRAAIHREDTIGTGDIWVRDLVRGSTSRLTFDPEHHNMAPVWSPDGRHVIFAKSTGTSWALYEKDASGVGEERLLYDTKGPAVAPWSVSHDGTTLVFSELDPDTNYDLYTLRLADGAKPSSYVRAPGLQVFGQFSADGRWLAYASGESGNTEVFVTSFPKPDSKYQISTNGGGQPRWRGDGRELFFRPLRTGGLVSMMAVTVDAAGSGLSIGIPKPLFEGTVSTVTHVVPLFTFAVSPDGQRFLVSRVPGASGPALETPLAVVVNWDSALKQ